MELSGRRLVPWRRLFLVASVLTSRTCRASGQLLISPDSLIGIAGYRSLLTLENVPEDVQEYSWYWGTEDSVETMIISYRPPDTRIPGPLYSNLVTVTTRGYLSFRRSSLNDTGNYTVRVDTGNGTQKATGWLQILELGDPPSISVNASSLVEYVDSVAAECHTHASSIDWYRISVPISGSSRIRISPDGRTLAILRVSRHDRTLQCAIESFPEILQKSDMVSLTVAYGPDYVSLNTNLDIRDDTLTAGIGSQVELECSCYSNPDSKYHWLHNGSLLSSEAKVNFSILAWEQMGSYRCIAENPVTQLAMYSDIRIQPPRPSPTSPPHTDSYISGSLVVILIVVTVLGCGYLCGILVYCLVKLHFRRQPVPAWDPLVR